MVKKDCEILAYADEVVYYTRKEVAMYCAKIFIECATGFDLKVNIRKTNTLQITLTNPLKNCKLRKQKIVDTLVHGNLPHQLIKTRKIIIQKSSQLRIMRRVVLIRILTKLRTLSILLHEELATHQDQLFQKSNGAEKEFPKPMVDGIMQRLEYDLKENGHIKRQLRIALFRKHLYNYAPEGFMWYQASQPTNFFWNQFSNQDTKLFDLEDDRADELIICQEDSMKRMEITILDSSCSERNLGQWRSWKNISYSDDKSIRLWNVKAEQQINFHSMQMTKIQVKKERYH